MQLKGYQTTAIKKLLSRSKELLLQNGGKNLVFKAPTGSGKTIITAEFLKQLVNDPELQTPLSFIWTAPRQLHTQSKQKLEQYYEDTRALECVDFADLVDRQIDENQVLFLNWESINKRDKNTIVKENEQEFYLGKIIEATKDAGRDIVLIIDESHHHATSEISKELVVDIGPKLTIEVSATPVLQQPDEIVTVPIEDVKAEGMIKKSVRLNPDFENILTGANLKTALADGTDAMVLEAALTKRAELRDQYEEAGINVNPLLLIQLPDRKTQQEDQIKTDVIALLRDKYDIRTDNGKLAIYLSEEKENLANIAKNDNDTEVLIFKQAIALGWDCPRAQILVLFRDWKSLTFSVQTVGRIMRMPEPETGHYENDVLNYGYAYTNLSDIEIADDIARGYVTIYTSKRITSYQSLGLESVHRIRARERTRLSPTFLKVFLDEAIRYDLQKKVITEGQSVKAALISDLEAASVDALAKQHFEGEVSINLENEKDLQKLYDYFVRNNLAPQFYPEDRSIGRVKEAIYYFFRMRLGMHFADHFSDIIKIVLSSDNIQHFSSVIDAAKEKYISDSQKRDVQLESTTGWEVPVSMNFTGDYAEKSVKKSAMNPFYYDNRWKTEEAFIDFMEQSKSIDWWFKNGDRDSVFFAVPYEENEEPKPFYVDFIVHFTDGTIGLFDTKGGQTITTAKEKSDGLQHYIKTHSTKSKKIIGGIVANTQPRNYSGRWMVYTGRSTDLVAGDFANWKQVSI